LIEQFEDKINYVELYC